TREKTMIAPCPFCASEHTEIIEADLDGWAVECRGCKTTGPIGKSRELAELLWNERVLYAELRKCG
ncbi:hypothetical protein, partial [Sideroxydans sp.]